MCLLVILSIALIYVFWNRRNRKLEIVFENFKGLQESRKPLPGGCSSILNLDPRGNWDTETYGAEGSPSSVKGDLIFRPKVEAFLDLPGNAGQYSAISTIGFTHVYITQFATSQEVTIAIQKATVTKTDPSASIATKNIVLVSMYPEYQAGTGWVNQWYKLNDMVISRITAVDSAKYQIYGQTSSSWTVGDTIYNVTKSKYATILNVSAGTPDDFYTDTTGFDATDTVILMRNFIPTTNLESNYSAALADVVFHNVINDLRVGFGGQSGRLGLGVGHRKKYFNIKSITTYNAYLANLQSIDKILLGAFNHTAVASSIKVTVTKGVGYTGGNPFPYDDFKSLYLHMSVVLDGRDEFLLTPIDTDLEIGDDYAYAMAAPSALGGSAQDNRLLVAPVINFGTINKRITHVRIYLAQGKGASSYFVRSSSYYLVKELEIANYSASTTDEAKGTWYLDSDGYLKPYNSVVGSSNQVEINYDHWNARGATLQSNIGGISTNYLQSWDQAISALGRVFYLNGYIDQRHVNRIFASDINEYGGSMYDVVNNLSDVSAAEKKDNDEAIGIELLPNMDIAMFKQNSIGRLDTTTLQFVDWIMGIGAVSRAGIVNYKDKIIFPSQYGIHVYDGVNIKNIIDGEFNTLYKDITTKSLIVATKDPLMNTYRLTHPSFSYKEYLYTEGFGWYIFRYPDEANGVYNAYALSPSTNVVRFLMSTGNTLKQISSKRNAVDLTSLTTIEWISNEININDYDQSDNMQFILNKIYILYKSCIALTIDFILDGTTITDSQIAVPASVTDAELRQRTKASLTAKKFKIKLSGTFGTYSGQGSIVPALRKIKIGADIVKIGRW